MEHEAIELEKANQLRREQIELQRQAVAERRARVEAMQGLFDAGLNTLGGPEGGLVGAVEALIDQLAHEGPQ